MATKKQQSKQPANPLGCGDIKATIGNNEGQNGPFFFSANFSRPFKDHASQWRQNSTSFGLIDLEVRLALAGHARNWIVAQMFKC